MKTMNKPKKITGVLVDVAAGTLKKRTFTYSLDTLYKLLHCTCIDISTCTLQGHEFDIVCDDEFLLKPARRMSAVDTHLQSVFAGNLFFCHHDTEGHLTSVTPEDFKLILRNACLCRSEVDDALWLAVKNLEYC